MAGSVLTAAQLNSNVRDAINFVINRPVCDLRQTVAQALTNNAHTLITFDTEDVDNDNMHSPTTNPTRMTAQTAGRFTISAAVSFATNTSGRRLTSWFVNGTELSSAQLEFGIAVSGNATQICSRTREIFLNVGDYLEADAFQNSGGSLNTVVSTANQPNASVHWFGTT